MAGKTISQKITLEGGDEIRKALEQLAQAAADSAAKIQEASKAGAGGFEDTGKAAAEAAQGLGQAGQAGEQAAEGISKAAEASTAAAEGLQQTAAAADQASESYRNISLESAKAAVEIAKTGVEIALTATKIGLLITRHESLTKSLVKLAFETSSTTRALGLLAEIVGPTAVAFTVAGAAVAAAAVGLKILETAATAAAKGYADLNHQLDTLSQTSGVSFSTLQTGAAAFEQIGIKGETARQAVVKLNDTLKDFDPGAKIKASADAALQAEKALLEAQLAVQAAGGNQAPYEAAQRLYQINQQLATTVTDRAKAEEAAGKAAEDSSKAQANQLTKVIALIKQIEEGQKGIKFDELTTAETKIDALNARLKQLKGATGDARQEFLKIIANAPTLKDALAFGATVGFSADDVDRIRRFGGEATKIPDLFQRISQSGALIGPTASKAFDDMRTSIQGVETAQARLDAALQSSVLAQIGALISTSLNQAEAAFITFEAQVVEGFNTVVGEFMRGVGRIGTIVIESFIGVGVLIEQAVVQIGAIISNWVLTPIAGAWQWIAETFTSAMSGLSGALDAGKQLIVDWVITPIEGAWQWIVDTFTGMVQGGFTSALDAGKQAITDWVTTPVANAWQWVVDAWNAMLQKLGFGGGGSGTPAPAGAGGQSFASGGLLGGRGTGTSDSNLAWVSRGEYIMPARAVAQPGVLAFLEALRRSGGLDRFADGGAVGGSSGGGVVPARAVISVIERVRQMIDSLGSAIASMNDALIDAMYGVVRNIDRTMTAFSDNIAAIMESTKTASDTLWDFQQQIEGKATGGLLGGRGTGTSDSNLAWVSRGEYITPASAVAQPGVLAFLEALRRSGGNLRAVLDGMGRFALGGMVGRLGIPAFAGSGGMSHVTINFPGLPEITGLRGSSGVVDELRKAAAMAQVRSGGRKPSRFS